MTTLKLCQILFRHRWNQRKKLISIRQKTISYSKIKLGTRLKYHTLRVFLHFAQLS